MGCGTRLLRFAMSQYISAPRLWLLSNNAGAHRLYLREGFLPTGGRHVLTDTLFELEMRCERQR